MAQLRYIFMGTPPLAATILEMLCRDLHSPEMVVTQVAKAVGRGQKVQATPVELMAKQLGVNVMSALDVNAPPTVDALKTFRPDLILVAAFGQILRQDILTMPTKYCLNVHASLLPAYRGAAPFQRAILNGDAVTGITIQKMARKLDTGDVLLQRELEILSDETSGELLDRLANLGGECLIEAVRQIEAGSERFIPQDDSKATYAAKIAKEESVIDWRKPAKVIHNQIRGLQPWPVAETKLGNDRLKVFKAALANEKSSRPPGELLTDGKSFLSVTCGDGQVLSLTEIQPENRKRLNIKDFLNSYRGNFPYERLTLDG